MLDLGFIEDVERILRMCPSGRQTMLFSATMPPPIARLAEAYMYDPVTISITPKKLTVDAIEQAYVEVEPKRQDRPPRRGAEGRGARAGDRLLPDEDRHRPARPARSATAACQSKALHGDMSQGQRDGVMISFKEHKSPLLVATDVAARGLDIEHVTHVINYDLPNNSEIYVHRIGRTGRVGRTGRAITFVTPKERGELERIERDVKTSIGEWEPPEERIEHAPRPKRRHEAAERDGEAGEPAGEAGARRRAPEPRSRAPSTEAGRAAPDVAARRSTSSSSSTAARAAGSPRRTSAGRSIEGAVVPEDVDPRRPGPRALHVRRPRRRAGRAGARAARRHEAEGQADPARVREGIGPRWRSRRGAGPRHAVVLAAASRRCSAPSACSGSRDLDLAAQVFRADLWDAHGWVIYNAAGTAATPSPATACSTRRSAPCSGRSCSGAICAVVAAVAFAAIAVRAYGPRAWLGAAWFGVAVDRLAVRRPDHVRPRPRPRPARDARNPAQPGVEAAPRGGGGRRWPARSAGAFTALAAAALLIASRLQPIATPARRARNRAAAFALIGAVAATIALAFAFPTGGYQPFNVRSRSSGSRSPARSASPFLPVGETHPRVRLRALRGSSRSSPSAFDDAVRQQRDPPRRDLRRAADGAGAVPAPAADPALLAAPLLWWQWSATLRDVRRRPATLDRARLLRAAGRRARGRLRGQPDPGRDPADAEPLGVRVRR